MKKLLLLSLFIIPAAWVRSQVDPAKNLYSNELRVGFFQFFVNTFYMEYEHMFSNNTSVVLTGGTTLKKDNYEEIYGGQGGIQFRVYAGHFGNEDMAVRLESGYFGPFFRYKYMDVTDLDGADFNSSWMAGPISNIYNTYSGGILLGLKIVALQRLTFDMSIGGGIQYTDSENDLVPDYAINLFGIAYSGVAPTANFTFGFRF